MSVIAENGVCLDMCPISNYKLRVVDSWQDHPLELFLDRGIRCTVSTDDPFSFNNSLEDEYLACVEKLGLPPSRLVEIAKNGFHVADLPMRERDYFLHDIDESGVNF